MRHSFNPTVVRLGPAAGRRQHRRRPACFQSHCGAIGTRICSGGGSLGRPPSHSHLSIPLWCDWDCDFDNECSYLLPLSIPLWCDWDNSPVTRRLHVPRLSIPLWCDWDRCHGCRRRPPPELSIPLWCDWDGMDFFRSSHRSPTFNPTVVRLGLPPT